MQPKVVIAKRRRTRVLANAEQVQAVLEQAGMQPSIVDFGALSFEAQVRRQMRSDPAPAGAT